MYKILVKYTKKDRLKFISHLELLKVMERALRRANIPLKFTQGFNPHPIISFAAPLSVGVSSEGEYFTIEVNKKIDLKEFVKKLNSELPNGIKFLMAKYIDPKSKSLMSIVEYSTYVVKCETMRQYSLKEVNDIIEKFLSKKEIIYKKEGKRNKIKYINIKNLIKDIIVLSVEDKDIYLKIILSTGSKGNLKPEVLMDKLVETENIELNLEELRVHRLELFMSNRDGVIIPLDRIN